MKKNKIKIIIGFGATTSLVAVGSVILSCGNSNPNPGPNQSELNAKLNAVTPKMVVDYVMTQTGFIPSATVDVPATAPSKTLTKVTLNGVSGLTITISNWTANATLGSVTFDVFIFDEGLTTKAITGVTYDGWITTDQKALNEVTTQMVSDYIKMWGVFIPSYTTVVPETAPSNTITNATLNGIDGLTISISNWIANDTLGSVTFDVSISKTGLVAKSIAGVTYDGWITTDQRKLDAVTPKMVADYVKQQQGFIPSPTADVPEIAPSTTLNNATLNGLSGLTITISNWAPSYPLGLVTFDASISKNRLIPKNIVGVTYDGYKTYEKVISNDNVIGAEGKLWFWNDSTKTLTISNGITEIIETINQPLIWGKHDINTVAYINFPNTLTTIGVGAFINLKGPNLKSLDIPASVTYIGINALFFLQKTSIHFLGDIPAQGKTNRILVLMDASFGSTPISNIVGSNWQIWAMAHYPNAFKE